MRPGFVTGLVAEARIARRLGPAQAGGGTAEGARRAALALLRDGADALVSFGLAGGLDPALRPGTVVVPLHLVAEGTSFAIDQGLAATLGDAHGIVADSRYILATAAQKTSLRAATGAHAVDMESAAVASMAHEAGVPFAVLRAVCDPAERDLPPAASRALDAAGAVSLGRVLASLARRPGQLPALLRLAADAAAARAALVRRVDNLCRRGGLVRQL